MFAHKPTRELLIGVRLIETISDCAIVGDILHVPEKNFWSIPISLCHGSIPDLIPPKSFWHVVVSENYPYGSIDVFPSKEGGITATFQHQELNDDSKFPFKNGKICLASPRRSSFITDQFDPVGDSEERLRWHVSRALEWIEAAVSGSLAKKGDPFELPRILVFSKQIGRSANGGLLTLDGSISSNQGILYQKQNPTGSSGDYLPKTEDSSLSSVIVHDESTSCFHLWGNNKFGMLSLAKSDISDTLLIAYKFNTLEHKTIRKWDGRTKGSCEKIPYNGFWWIWSSPIVNKPWQAPHTWGELRTAGGVQGVDVDSFLKRIMSLSMNKGSNQILLLGYPMPEKTGGNSVEIYWQAIRIPLPIKKHVQGYRDNEHGQWEYYKKKFMRNNAPIIYLETVNWHPDRLQKRGKLSMSMINKRIAVVGLGALGSCVVDILARMGVSDFLLLDNDIVESGNVTRHQATLADIGVPKVIAVKEKLEKINPSLKVEICNSKMPDNQKEIEDVFHNCDMIVDCTASDEVINLLSSMWWPAPKYIASFSLGYEAKKLYAYTSYKQNFSAATFFDLTKKFVEEDKEHLDGNDFFEGAGCWQPIFPARYDNINFAAVKCVKLLEKLCEVKEEFSSVGIFSYYEDDFYTGYKKLNGAEHVTS